MKRGIGHSWRIACSVVVLTVASGASIGLLGASTARSSQDESQGESQGESQSTAQTAVATPSAAPAASAAATTPATSNGAQAENDADSGNDSCLTDPAVVKELNTKKQQLDEKARDLSAKEAELKARETAINDEMKKLDDLRDQITGIETARKQENADKVAKIVSTLEGMSPKAAAQMLTELDDGLAVAAISQMSTAKLSKVMNTLDPKRAAKLTELLAGVVRAKNTDASNDAAVTTNIAKGGETNDKQSNKQPESIISGGPQQFASRGTASTGPSGGK